MNGQILWRFGLVLACLASLTLCESAWAAPKAKKYTSLFRDATVFCDLDGDLRQGTGEKSVLTDHENGVYLPPPCKKGRLVLRGGIDIVTGKPNDRLQVLPLAARAPQAGSSGQANPNGQTWEKNAESKAFNLVTRVWKALQDNGQTNDRANDILNQWVGCIGGICYDTTPDAKRKPADLKPGEREMWLAQGQLSVLNDAIEKLVYRLQGQRFYGDEQNSISALAQALVYVYGDRGRPPELANLRDVSDLLDHALTLMQIRGPAGYQADLPDIADLAIELNDAFDAALGARQANFKPYQNLQIAVGKAAQDLGDDLDWAALKNCYTGAGLRQRLDDPAQYCEGDRTQTRCVLPDPATETRAKACPGGQSGAIAQTCVWSCPNPTGNPVQSCADTANDCRTTSANHPPVAAAQSVTATAGVALSVTLSASDQDRDALTYSVVGLPSRGSLGGTPPNMLYTANAGYSGQDSFSFKASDGQADSDAAAVSVTVKAACALPNPSTETRAQNCPAGQTGSITQTRTASCPNPGGNPVWSDWIATSDTCQAQSVNRKPVAAAQSVTATAGVALSVTLSASDADGDALSYSVASFPSHGGLGGTPPNLTYTAAAGYSGQDSFSFKASDGQADSDAAAVSVTVKAACALPNPSTETRAQNCPAGQTGSITQTRTASCPNPGGNPVWSDWIATSSTCQTPVSSGIEPEMARLPGGTFQMGSPASEAERYSDETLHTVTVGAFSIGKYEVTQGQWKAVMGSNPSGFSSCGDDCPVEGVSWNDVQDYLAALNRQTGKRYRLPTEAEWEYAARAGTATAYWWGATASHEYANYGTDSCCDGFASGRDQWVNTAPVGSFPANAFGLYDMSGNVWEWTCSDYISSYDGHESTCNNSASNPRALRGGSWGDVPRSVRSAYRYRVDPALRLVDLGFRLAQD
jgi:formylglycine-generating enzyme required for sulfatase activity